jgi:hypothetical protein
MTIEEYEQELRELEQAVRELTVEVARQAGRLEALEQAAERRYQADQELSAHLNGMTYP